MGDTAGGLSNIGPIHDVLGVDLNTLPFDRKIKVLIVDDHPLVRSGARIMLNDPAIEVVGEAASGAESIRLVGTLRPDVVLMDIGMPDMNGLEATAAIKRDSSEVAVVILTGDSGREFIRGAIEAGAVGYLRKGATREVLLQAVKLTQAGAGLFDMGLISAITKEDEPEDHVVVIDTTLSALAPRELEVLRHLAAGLTNKEIASAMNYSIGTVKNVVQRVIEKLAVADRTQAAVLAVRAGLDA